MKKLLTYNLLILFILFSQKAISSCYSKYDWATGNSYQVCNNGGSTTIRGNNFGTGSSWTQTQNSNGTYSGTDKNGNYYTGNNNTGQYYNYGTGKSCYGKGAFRTCY